MKWGVRKKSPGYSGPSAGYKYSVRKSPKVTGVSRRDGAHIDLNDNEIRTLTRRRDGAGLNKAKAEVGKRLIGEARREKMYNIEIKALKDQNDRIRAGEKTLADKADQFNKVSLTTLYISVRPKE